MGCLFGFQGKLLFVFFEEGKLPLREHELINDRRIRNKITI